LERTFLKFEEGQKINFFKDFKAAEQKIVKIFVEMKKIVEKVIKIINTNYKDFLNIMKRMNDEFINSNIGEVVEGIEVYFNIGISYN